ncbi:hypothetical protein LINPERHAP1_LOCUS37028, partial [Linum perenne]
QIPLFSDQPPTKLWFLSSRLNRTELLVPFDTIQSHEQKPSFNFDFGSLVIENRGKTQSVKLGFIRLAKMPIQSLARTFGPN